MHEPTLVEHLPADLDWCADNDSDGALCREVIRLLRAGRYRSPQVLLAHFHGTTEGQRLQELARRELLIPRAARAAELEGLIEHFRRQNSAAAPEAEINELLARQRDGERLSSTERQRLMTLFQIAKR